MRIPPSSASWGWTRAPLAAMTAWPGCGPRPGRRPRARVGEAIAGLRPFAAEWRADDGGAGGRWWELMLYPGGGGSVATVVGVLRDITARKHDEERLARRERQLLAIIRNAPVILTTVDAEGRIELNEGRGLEALGLTRDQKIGQSIFEMYPDASPMGVGICRALAGEAADLVLNLGGRVFESQFVPEFDARGEVRGVHGIAIDITERYHAERKFRDNQELLRLILDAAEVGICLLDEEFRFVMVNPRYCRLHGHAFEELIGRRIMDMVHADDRAAFAAALRGILAGERPNGPVKCRGLARLGDELELQVAVGRLVRRDRRAFLVCSVLDQTGHLRDAAELAVWEERYEAAAQASGQVLYDWDSRTNLLRFRGATEAILGYGVEELDGPMGDFFNLMPPGIGAATRTDMSLRIAAKGPYSREYPFSRKDGSIAILQDRGRFILDHSGRVVRMVGFIADVTMIKGAEERLRRQKEILQTILDNMPGLLTYTGPNGRILLANPEWERLAGASVVGRPLRQAIAPLLANPEEADAFVGFHRQPAGVSRVFQLLGAGGVLVEVSWAVTGLSDGSRIAIGTDVTEFKRARREILQSHALLESIQLVQSQFINSQGSEKIFETMLGSMLALTDSATGFIGEVAGAEGGQPSLRVHAIADGPGAGSAIGGGRGGAADCPLLACLDTLLGAVLRADEAVLTNSPEADLAIEGQLPGCPALGSFLGLPLKRGQRLVGMVGLANRPGGYSEELVSYLKPFWSTTAAIIEAYQGELQQQRLEGDLRASKEAADSANQAKSLFLANMSHEIRTPLTAILGYADMLLSADAPLAEADRDGTLLAIQSNGEHLFQIISDILDISKIEADKLELAREPESPWSLVREVVAGFAPRAAGQGLWLRAAAPEGCPREVTTDGTRFRQILMNLVSNAVKFTQEGGVDLEVGVEREDGGEPRLRVTVADTGPGIGPDHLGRLFHPFQQGDASMTRTHGGTGLGLSISKRLAIALGGDLSAASTPDVGSVFIVRLPLTAEQASDCAAPESPDFGPEPASGEQPPPSRLAGSILLVEDGGDNQVVIGHFLRQAGLEVVVAENGQSALDQIRPGHPAFDAVLMDIQMPVMNGYDATRGLRRLGYAGPIIALTANALESDRQNCLEAGCNDYISKPINRNALLRMLGGYLDGAMAERVAPDPPVEPLHSRFAPDPEFHAILRDYGDRLPAQVEEIRQAVADRDFIRIGYVAHKMVGAGGMYGFPELTLAARVLEATVTEQVPVEMAKVEEGLEAVRKLVRRIRAGLGPEGFSPRDGAILGPPPPPAPRKELADWRA
jgi:PAS domain S-box-containing protein